jgi:D-glycero-alpha-D-manno-heptose 1-phosphate guanylyltransferase
MDTIILAGGKGTRLKNILHNIPKALAPINGIPFLDLVISYLQDQKEIKKIILSVGYLKHQIINRYKNLKNIIFSQETIPLGTGGAIKKALNSTDSENILVLNGDTYANFSLKKFLEFHIKKNSDLTILSTREKNISRYGNLIFDENQKILSFNEKNKKNEGYINSGVYLIKKNIFNSFKSIDSFSFEKEYLPFIINTKNIFSFKTSSFFIDIGTEESYFKAQKIFKIF